MLTFVNEIAANPECRVPYTVIRHFPLMTILANIFFRCLEVDVTKNPAEWTQQWPFPVLARVNGFHVVLDQARRYTNGKLAGVDMATNIHEYLRTQSSVYSENTNMNLVILKRYGKATPSSGPVKAYLLFAQQVRSLHIRFRRKHAIAFWSHDLSEAYDDRCS
mmetsp:Transcript_20754/g.84349  ORF Transcript_20754/g.84349 Transcript_20754/m.84349 type:complete len:163 (-) Transcript_20754:155-643(-)